MNSTNDRYKGRRPIDRIYDIITVQAVGAVIFLTVAAVVRLIGGELYENARAIYFKKISQPTTASVVTEDRNDGESNEGGVNTSSSTSEVDEQSGELTEAVSSEEASASSADDSSRLIPTYYETAVISSGNTLIWPITGKITSLFGEREAPTEGSSTAHEGIDISGEWGAEISAAADGFVYYVGESDGYGKHLIISHGESFKTLYAHCSEIVVKEGQVVKQGETVALVGNTGRATGSHLHFETLIANRPIDPTWLLSDMRPI